MARNVNVIISSENDGTTRNNVPDFLIHFDATWIGDDGEEHSAQVDEYFLLLLNWLKTNYPVKAREVMQDLAFQIARAKYNIDAIGD